MIVSNTLLESLWARVDTNIGARIKQISELLTQALSANTEATSARDIAVAAEQTATTAATNAASSEAAAKSAESSASSHAQSAQASAANSLSAAERAELAAEETIQQVEGDFATRNYVDQRVPVDMLTGTGFPEGKVAAPVGTVYTDTAATNGAIRWIKVSGTDNTGWSVEYGDTGRRVLHDDNNPPTTGAGTVRIHRVGDTVSLSIFAYKIGSGTTSANTLFTIPAGFRPEHSLYSHHIVDRDFRDTTHASLDIHSLGMVSVIGSPSGRIYLNVTWLTGDPWPTTLPGTPA